MATKNTQDAKVTVAEGVQVKVLSKQMIQLPDEDDLPTFAYIRAVHRKAMVCADTKAKFYIWSPWKEGPRNVTKLPTLWFTDRAKAALSAGAKAANDALRQLAGR